MTRKTTLPLLMALALGWAATAMPADIAGTWTAKIHVPDTPMGELNLDYTYEFEGEGDETTGTATLADFMGQGPFENAIEKIEIEGDKVSFVEQMDMQGQVLSIAYEGTIKGDEIEFSRQVGDFPKEQFTAKRKKD